MVPGLHYQLSGNFSNASIDFIAAKTTTYQQEDGYHLVKTINHLLTCSKNLTITDQEDSGVTIDDHARTMDELLENDDNVFEELPVETRRRLLRWKLAVYFFTGVIFFLLVMLVVVGIQPRSGKELEEPGNDEPMWDDNSEHIADDPRLEKFQTPSDTTFCAPWPF
ncbi:uncharacterized protein C8R40DRAFT_1168677 [Lentinula edodes]|uniref:uncharacterized protein n=1 Tax=Lentinula edodes TaxID=5353 RepID=UPI001E8E4FCB|nr:uncharacterized protein C8R40DRAFT_1168677 [Lentinula edodes]KAH7877341.1 hypothetical protein C8R40DRAFT_1168677 [Lentinula edodes]